MNNKEWQIRDKASSKGWSPSHKILTGLINKNQICTAIEIGVAYGANSYSILKNTRVKKLYGIDSYKHIQNYEDPMNYSQEDFNSLYLYVTNKFKYLKNRYTLIRKSSFEASKVIENKVDLIYIDADHSYKGITQDLYLWFQKVKDGGIMSGHDYDHRDFPGVTKAVNKFFYNCGITVNYAGEGVWWVKKPMGFHITYIMPAFNSEKTINESINSINKVFIPGDEVVVVDDCSSDDTVKKATTNRVPIRLIRHKKNRGGSFSRNTAIKHSHNKKIFCLDSDNILDKESFIKLRRYSNKYPNRCIFFEELHFFKTIFKIRIFTHNWVFKKNIYTLNDYLNTKIVPGASGNYLFTKESWLKVGGYPKKAGALDTWGFGLYQTMFGFNQYRIKGTHYNHRYGTNSYYIRDSKKNDELEIKRLAILKRHIDKIPIKYKNKIKNLKIKWYSTVKND